MVGLDAGGPVITPVQAIALAIALSVAGNVALGRAWLSVRDDLTTAILQRDQANTYDSFGTIEVQSQFGHWILNAPETAPLEILWG